MHLPADFSWYVIIGIYENKTFHEGYLNRYILKHLITKHTRQTNWTFSHKTTLIIRSLALFVAINWWWSFLAETTKLLNSEFNWTRKPISSRWFIIIKMPTLFTNMAKKIIKIVQKWSKTWDGFYQISDPFRLNITGCFDL